MHLVEIKPGDSAFIYKSQNRKKMPLTIIIYTVVVVSSVMIFPSGLK